MSWAEYAGAARALAARLEGEGVEQGSRVLLFADGSPAWLLADLAILLRGATSVPVYPTSAPSQVAAIARRSGARVAVCDAPRASSVRGLPGIAGCLVVGEDALSERVDGGAERVGSSDLAVLLFTSGATGDPKGARLTHRNLMATATARLAVTRLDESDRTLCVLPLSHVAGRMNYQVYPAVTGAQVWFGGGLATLFDDLADCRPTYFFGVPRVYEKLAGELERLSSSMDAAAARRRLGLDALRFTTSGGAPIAVDLIESLASFGVEVLELYGQTETTGLTTLNPPGAIRRGTVGVPLPGVDVAVASDGEIRVRGDNVCDGYEGDPARTAAAIDADGWLRSGDLGSLDLDGYLTITGRKHELIVTSGGKNVFPAPIEGRIEAHPAVSRAMVVGDARPYLVALVETASEPARAAASIRAHIEAVNGEFARPEQVKRAALVARFPEEGFTSTMKLRRNALERLLEPVVRGLYERPHTDEVECVIADDDAVLAAAGGARA